MGIPSKRKLKEDAVPTIFCFSNEPKSRPTSEARSERAIKRRFIDKVYEERNVEPIGTENIEPVSKAPVMVDKSVTAGTSFKKMTSRGTQYHDQPNRQQDKENAHNIDFPGPLKVKFEKKKTGTKVKETNTTVTFPPDVEVTFKIECSDNKEPMEEIESSSDEEEDDPSDPTFEPDPTDSDDLDNDIESEETIGLPNTNTKFLVYWSCLAQLLSFCSICHQVASITKCVTRGTKIIVTKLCANNHETKWDSQPDVRGMAAGNLLMAASILCSGATYRRISEMMGIAEVAFISERSFYKIQKSYLLPAIHHVYTTFRALIICEIIENGPIHVNGDGRCDSPGYSAKYGTYTIMNSADGQILDFNVSHCRIAGNSNRMELFGLKDLLKRLKEYGIQILSLTTDRHTQVRKFMRTECTDISHQFDIWHFCKSIKKRLMKAAKAKKNAELLLWVKSIINHFWWCCKTCDGNVEILKEKWLSILEHITNKHTFKGNKYYKSCEHGKRLRRKWLKKDSSAFTALKKIVADPKLLADFPYLTKFNHTGNLEVFHSLYNKYCPKRLHFSYEVMVARSQLAVLDHNSSVGLQQAVTKSGKKRTKITFTRITQSWVSKPIKEPKDKSYIKNILEEVFYLRETSEKYPLPNIPKPPKNIATEPKPDKEEVIRRSRSRFH